MKIVKKRNALLAGKNLTDKGESARKDLKIFIESFKSAIPRYVWKAKNFLLIDDMLGKLYGVKPKEIDIGKNNFGVIQLEIGYLSVIAVPILILSLLLFMGLLNKISTKHSLILWIFSGNIIPWGEIDFGLLLINKQKSSNLL